MEDRQCVLLVVKKDGVVGRIRISTRFPSESPRIRDAKEAGTQKRPPERPRSWPDTRILHWCAMCIDSTETTPVPIMEPGMGKTIGGLSMVTRVQRLSEAWPATLIW